jgi:hypothetical protein
MDFIYHIKQTGTEFWGNRTFRKSSSESNLDKTVRSCLILYTETMF